MQVSARLDGFGQALAANVTNAVVPAEHTRHTIQFRVTHLLLPSQI